MNVKQKLRKALREGAISQEDHDFSEAWYSRLNRVDKSQFVSYVAAWPECKHRGFYHRARDSGSFRTDYHRAAWTLSRYPGHVVRAFKVTSGV